MSTSKKPNILVLYTALVFVVSIIKPGKQTKDDAPNRGVLWAVIVSSMVGAAIGLIAIAFGIFMLVKGSAPASILGDALLLSDIDVEILDNYEKSAINSLILKGFVVTPQDLVITLSSFYTFIIQVLLVVIGAISGLAFFYIKFTSRDRLEDEVESQVTKTFKESRSFQEDLKGYVDENYKPQISELRISMMDLDDQLKEVSSLRKEFSYTKKRVSELERILSESDTVESSSSDSEDTVSIPGEGDENGHS